MVSREADWEYSMQEWLRNQLASGFGGFAGTSISASLRMSENLLNELLAAALQDAASSGERLGGAAGPLAIDQLLKLVASTELRALEGAVTLNVEIRV